MILLHTSDWHLGMPVGAGSYEEDHRFFLEQLLQVIRTRHVGAVLLAGDVYDSSVSNAAAISVYNDAVTAIFAELGIPMIVIAGNHDSASRLSSCRLFFQHESAGYTYIISLLRYSDNEMTVFSGHGVSFNAEFLQNFHICPSVPAAASLV